MIIIDAKNSGFLWGGLNDSYLAWKCLFSESCGDSGTGCHHWTVPTLRTCSATNLKQLDNNATCYRTQVCLWSLPCLVTPSILLLNFVKVVTWIPPSCKVRRWICLNWYMDLSFLFNVHCTWIYRNWYVDLTIFSMDLSKLLFPFSKEISYIWMFSPSACFVTAWHSVDTFHSVVFSLCKYRRGESSSSLES